MASSSRAALVSFLGVALLVAGLLHLGPRVPPTRQRPIWTTNVDLPGPFGLSLSVDSPLFMELALHPSRLLGPRQPRQSRPGLVLAAAAPANVLALVMPATVAAYLAYLALAIATIVASFACYLAIVQPAGGPVSCLVFVPGLLLLFNPVTIDFLLSPHTALFNVLAPIAALWIAHRAWRDDLVRQPAALGVALLIGVGFTMYPSFGLGLPALLLPAAARLRAAGQWPGAAFLKRATVLTTVALAPTGVWMALVIVRTGTFYSAEVDMFRMFVWMADDVATRGALAMLAKLAALGRALAWEAFGLALPSLGLVAAMVLVAPTPARGLWPLLRADVALAGLVGALFALFSVLSGYVWERNVYAATVPLVAVAGASAARVETRLPTERRRIVAWALVPAAVAFGGYMLLRDVTHWWR